MSDYIADYLPEQLRIKDFVSSSGLHAKKLQAGFRHFFGESINEFVHSARMAKAKELIEITNQSLNDICGQIGFAIRSYLSRTFSERYGVSPTDYRNSVKNLALVYELIYWSNAKIGIGQSDIDKIVFTSEMANKNRNITGCPIHFNTNFFQVVEGE